MSVIEVFRGDAPLIPFSVTAADGTAYDLTDGTLRFTVRDRSDGSLVIEKTEGAGITVDDDPTSGLFNVQLVIADTDAVDELTFWRYDAQVTSGGLPLTIDIGTLIVRPDVSRIAP